MKVTTKKERLMTIDEILEHANAFGPFQWMLWLMMFLIMFASFNPVLVFYFAAMDSKWRCAENSSVCKLNGTYGPYDDEWGLRCKMDRHDWYNVENTDFSIMTHFDLYCDTSYWKPLMSSIIFASWALGGPVLGWVSDKCGRKKVMFISLLIEILSMVFSTLAHQPWVILIFRIIIGFFLPGAMVQQYIMSVEFSPAKKRGLFVNGLMCGWPFVGAVQALKAYYITDWKVLLLSQSVPYLIIMPMYFFCPESLRWLNTHGRTEDAIKELKRIAKFNNKQIPDDIGILPEKEEMMSMDPRLLFKTKKATISSLIQGLQWIVCGLGGYGLLFISETGIKMNLLLLYAVMSLVELPGTAICIPLMNKYGRKKTVMGAQIFAGTSCLLCAFIPDEGIINYFRIVLAVVAKASIVGAFDTTYLWSSEIHPTVLRSNAMGYLQLMSRIGAVMTPWIADGLLEENKMAPFILIGSLVVLCALLLRWLPETKSEKTNETLNEYYGYPENLELRFRPNKSDPNANEILI